MSIPSGFLLGSRSFAIKRNAPARATSDEHLALSHARRQRRPCFGQPTNTPDGRLSLAVASNADAPSHIPDLDLSVHRATQQVLAGVVPIQRCDPGRIRIRHGQVADMFAVLHVVDRNDAGMTCGSKSLAPR